MRLGSLAILTVVTSIAMAQPSQTPAVNASISGMVKDASTGMPLANYTVSTNVNATWVDNTILMRPETKEVTSTTDDRGRYKLSDLPPGPYRIQVSDAHSFGHRHTKSIKLGDHDLEGIDFSFVVEGSVAGKVVDENKDPVPGMTVFLVSREYHLGSLGYFFRAISQTNDRGEYALANVEAGHPYFVMVEKRDRKLDARSETPLNPKLRKRVPMRTWYPNVAAREGAIAVTIRPGERREGIDVEVRKSPSYCIDGTLATAAGAGALQFSIEAQQPSSGLSGGGGMYVMPPFGVTSTDGRFRICDLYPGNYRLTASEAAANPNRQQPPSYIATTITITDRDLSNRKIAAMPGLPLDGEVVWYGDPPQTPIAAKLGISLQPLLRANFSGEDISARPAIPGTFSFPGLLMDEYAVSAFLTAPGLYVKDVTYAGRSVRNEPLRLGSAVGNAGLRVSVGRDGATIGARVTDKDGNPMADMQVLLMPAEIGSEAQLQALLLTGATDQLGQYKSSTLAPSKYYVAASGDLFDATPESINKLWRARSRFKEVDLAPNGNAQVSLEPVKIE